MCLLSIIIVSYNNKDVLIDCLDSISRQNDIEEELEVIVVEQSPSNDIYEYITENYSWVKTIRADNRGFGAGNNRGSEIAGGKYILFLNPDTVLVEPICKYAIDKFENTETLGLFGVQLLDANRNKTSSFDMNIPFGFWNKMEFKIMTKLGIFDERKMYIQGADLFVRKDLFEVVGRFDEEVFMYGEEPDLCTRIIRMGSHIEFDQTKSIIHLQGACSPQNYSLTFKRQISAFKRYCDKYEVDFDTCIRREMRLQNFKLFLFRITGKTDGIQFKISSQIIDVFKAYR